LGSAHPTERIQQFLNNNRKAKHIFQLKSVVEEEEREMEQRTGVQSSLEDKDVKSYVEEVLQEFGKTKIQK
jgi:hypothetical protein